CSSTAALAPSRRRCSLQAVVLPLLAAALQVVWWSGVRGRAARHGGHEAARRGGGGVELCAASACGRDPTPAGRAWTSRAGPRGAAVARALDGRGTDGGESREERWWWQEH